MSGPGGGPVAVGGGVLWSVISTGLHTVQGVSRRLGGLSRAEGGECADRSQAEVCATGRGQAGTGSCHGVEGVPTTVRRAFTAESLGEGGVSISVTGVWGREGELAGATAIKAGQWTCE